MFDLLSKLSTIHYAELDVDEILDKEKWIHLTVNGCGFIKPLKIKKRDKNIDDTKDVRGKSIYDGLPAIRLRRVIKIQGAAFYLS